MDMHGLTFATKLEAGSTRRLKTIATITAAALLVAGCEGAKVRSEKCGPNPVKAGQDQKVELKWINNAWKVKLNGGPEEDPKTAKIELKECVGPTKFVVDIQGKSATFKDPDGLTVWEGSKSAPQQGSTQILGPIVVTKNGKQELIFWDLNKGDPVILYYSIHFDDGTSVDPIIDNGGGDRW
jgi:hypothetical protein